MICKSTFKSFIKNTWVRVLLWTIILSSFYIILFFLLYSKVFTLDCVFFFRWGSCRRRRRTRHQTSSFCILRVPSFYEVVITLRGQPLTLLLYLYPWIFLFVDFYIPLMSQNHFCFSTCFLQNHVKHPDVTCYKFIIIITTFVCGLMLTLIFDTTLVLYWTYTWIGF